VTKTLMIYLSNHEAKLAADDKIQQRGLCLAEVGNSQPDLGVGHFRLDRSRIRRG
jgi:hypothetical protein